jgi:hypothetical protein
MGYDGTITALTAISKTKIGKLGEENNNLLLPGQSQTSCNTQTIGSVVSSIVVAIGLRPWFSSSRHKQRERGKMATTATTKVRKTMLYGKKKEVT